jgi:hypothetical protein
MNEPFQPAADNDVTLWLCETCGGSGVLFRPPEIQWPGDLRMAVAETHDAIYPECPLLSLITAPANGWFVEIEPKVLRIFARFHEAERKHMDLPKHS